MVDFLVGVGQALASHAINSVSGVASAGIGTLAITAFGGFIIWPMVSFLYAHFMPLNKLTQELKPKMRGFGVQVKKRLNKIKDEKLRNQIENEICEDSNILQEAFVEGVRNG